MGHPRPERGAPGAPVSRFAAPVLTDPRPAKPFTGAAEDYVGEGMDGMHTMQSPSPMES